MNSWAAYPFLRYVFWLSAGIVAANLIQWGSSGAFWVLTVVLILCLIILHFSGKRMKSFRIIQGLLASVILFSFGYARMTEQKEGLLPEKLPEVPAFWLLKAESDAEFTSKTVKIKAGILAKNTGTGWKPAKGKVLLYIRKEGLDKLPGQGSTLLVNGQINAVASPLNPAVFNFKDYLAIQGICCQAFITATDFRITETDVGNYLHGRAKKIRAWAISKIEEYVEGRQESAIVSSLVLGYRESLDQELVQAYSTAGTMHVLAVSGLHVGFLYFFLKFIFRSWRRKPKIKWISFLGTILVLWAYAFLTGLSPSVMRAAWMFCMLDAAFLLKRKSSIYNTMAIAAFVLLVLDPNVLWSVGFQLSFLAVAGIVYLQPRMAGWYKGKNKILRWVWGLVAVSFAAQFATFPLSLYYFGQFPSYFFITNLLVVPAIPFVLAIGFAMLLLSTVSSTLASGAGFCLHWLVWLINYVAFSAEALPYSRLTTNINLLQLFLLLTGLIMLLVFFHFRRFRFAVGVFLVFCGFIASLFLRSYQQERQKKLMVYHIPGYSLLQLAEGKKEFFMGDDHLPSAQIQYQVNPNRIVLGGTEDKFTATLDNDFLPAFKNQGNYSFLIWRGIRLVKITEPLPEECRQARPVAADYILLTHNAVKDLNVLSCYFSEGIIVIDGSNKPFLQKKLVKQAESLNLPFYLTSEKGALELNL